MEHQGRAGTRPFAAGLLVVLAAPPLGASVIIAWFAAGQGEFSLGYVPLKSALPASYLVGGVQALLAGAAVGWGIHRQAWINLGAWMALTIVLALPPVIYLVLTGGEREKPGLIYVSDFNIACYLIGAAIFASLVLRALIIALGWMRRHG